MSTGQARGTYLFCLRSISPSGNGLGLGWLRVVSVFRNRTEEQATFVGFPMLGGGCHEDGRCRVDAVTVAEPH